MKEMYGAPQRKPEGSEFHEHVMEGRTMCAALQPESAPQTRRAMTPQAGNRFLRSSMIIGQGIKTAVPEKKGADWCIPSREFRKAHMASIGNRLWEHDNEYDWYDKKVDLSKSRSHERYFQSSITTLPGPSLALNQVKARD